ncbi:MAG: hypothetical protein QW512_05735 [Thermofilaceae archaeon]
MDRARTRADGVLRAVIARLIPQVERATGCRLNQVLYGAERAAGDVRGFGALYEIRNWLRVPMETPFALYLQVIVNAEEEPPFVRCELYKVRKEPLSAAGDSPHPDELLPIPYEGAYTGRAERIAYSEAAYTPDALDKVVLSCASLLRDYVNNANERATQVLNVDFGSVARAVVDYINKRSDTERLLAGKITDWYYYVHHYGCADARDVFHRVYDAQTGFAVMRAFSPRKAVIEFGILCSAGGRADTSLASGIDIVVQLVLPDWRADIDVRERDGRTSEYVTNVAIYRVRAESSLTNEICYAVDGYFEQLARAGARGAAGKGAQSLTENLRAYNAGALFLGALVDIINRAIAHAYGSLWLSILRAAVPYKVYATFKPIVNEIESYEEDESVYYVARVYITTDECRFKGAAPPQDIKVRLLNLALDLVILRRAQGWFLESVSALLQESGGDYSVISNAPYIEINTLIESGADLARAVEKVLTAVFDMIASEEALLQYINSLVKSAL